MNTQTRMPWVWLLSIGLIATISYAIFALSSSGKKVVPEGLVVYYPKQRQTVSRVVSIAGKVKNTDMVWVVVHPVFKGDKFYVQDPILVDKNGNWSGEIIVGKPFDDTTAHIFEIRVFVNPSGRYQAIEEEGTVVFDSWPDKVDLATKAIMVTRKPKPGRPRSRYR